MIEACRAEAFKNNWNVSIAVVDEGGYLLGFERLGRRRLADRRDCDRKGAHCRAVPRDHQGAGGQGAQRLPFLRLPQYLPVQGGIPILIEKDCLGGIGVSGVQSENDELIANAGLAALG